LDLAAMPPLAGTNELVKRGAIGGCH
jgi:hypothetical protein